MAKTTEADKQQIIDWVNWWATKLQLDGFNITVKFHNRQDPKRGEAITFADVSYHYAGLDANMNIWLPFWGLPIEQKEKTCLHELTHILVPSATEMEICTLTEVMWRLTKEPK